MQNQSLMIFLIASVLSLPAILSWRLLTRLFRILTRKPTNVSTAIS